MKIMYKFADGTASEVEVSEEIGAVVLDSRRVEDNYKRYYKSEPFRVKTVMNI